MSKASNEERTKYPPPQFSLRTIFLCVTFVAVFLGGVVQFERLRAEAYKDAVRQAILDGRLPPENGRWLLGDEVNQLTTRRRES